MKHSIFVALFLSLLFTGCYSVERDCTAFHTGTFTFSQFIGDQLQTSRFVRNDTLEVEFYQQTVDSARIRWINDCECTLTKLHPTSNQDKRPISIRIIETRGDRYIFEYGFVGKTENRQRGEIIKISNELVSP